MRSAPDGVPASFHIEETMFITKPPLGKIEGRGYITRADGTRVEFILSGDATPAEVAEFLNQKEKEDTKDGCHIINRST